jgi:hypothetical protein
MICFAFISFSIPLLQSPKYFTQRRYEFFFILRINVCDKHREKRGEREGEVREREREGEWEREGERTKMQNSIIMIA